MNNVKQYVTRRRRVGDEIPYSDGYDEFIGRESTGRIVKFENGVAVDYFDGQRPVEHINVQNDMSPEIKVDEERVREPTMYRVTVEHDCGVNEFISDSLFDVQEYTNQLNQFYWNGFVKSIAVDGI